MGAMKPTPKNWSRLSAALYYSDPIKAIDWLCAAFGFEIRVKVPGENGLLMHSELTFGEAIVMVTGDASYAGHPGGTYWRSPLRLEGANTQSLMLYVDDVDAHCARARKAGAKIASEPKVTDYGEEYWTDKGYEAVDLEGHHFWFCERLRDPK